MMRIFISYAHVDKYIVGQLVEILRSASLDPWFDHRLIVGRDWKEQLRESIQVCDAFLYALSPESVASEWCQWEFAEAVKMGKSIIPVLIQARTNLPDTLSRYQYADFTAGPTPEGVAHLMGGLFHVRVTIPKSEIPPAPQSPSGVPAQAQTNSIQIAQTPLEEALERAHNFKGTKNSDWTPCIHTFDAIEMCLVPCGRFMMGSNDADDEKPPHEQIFTQPFWIDRYPVPNAEYKRAVDAGACEEPEDTEWYQDKKFANHPVEYVSWHQAVKYARWRSSLSGLPYRLPTEREWEYAARGVSNLIYPWGNEFVADNVVYGENSVSGTIGVTGRSGGKSWVEAMHLSGNVWEWCSSMYQSYPYKTNDGREDMGRTGVRRVLRGGSWRFDYAIGLRGSFRGGYILMTGTTTVSSVFASPVRYNVIGKRYRINPMSNQKRETDKSVGNTVLSK